MNDQILLEKTDHFIETERELVSQILENFREIDRRRLFSALGYKSLFDMIVKRYRYSEDEAYRRISAMRLIRDLPVVKELLDSGDLSLTHLSLAQSLFNREKKYHTALQPDEKMSVIAEIANKPVREAQRITRQLSSEPQLKPDSVVDVTDELIEFRFTGKKSLKEKIAALKGAMAHSHPNISLGNLFEQLVDLGLRELKKKISVAPRKHRVVKSKAQTRRDVLAKAKHRCQKCGSNYALQIDHIIPRAKGGTDLEENLRVLCRSCNQRAAIEDFGQRKMDRFIN